MPNSKENTQITEKIRVCEKKALTLARPDTLRLDEKTMAVGQHVWQGDVAFLRLEDAPKDAKLIRNRKVRQVVEGTTRGARHCVSMESMPKVMWYNPAVTDALTGPIMESSSVIEIEHPEHGNVCLPPGTYQIKYQRAYLPLQELKRQRD
jgi:hypothetical protein